MGYIWVVIKEREVRKHFALLDKISRQLMFYDIISILQTPRLGFWRKLKYDGTKSATICIVFSLSTKKKKKKGSVPFKKAWPELRSQ